MCETIKTHVTTPTGVVDAVCTRTLECVFSFSFSFQKNGYVVLILDYGHF